MRPNIKLLLISWAIAILSWGTPFVYAQTGKAPRVVEVENYLTNKTLEYVKGRFPATPILVTVSLEPLRSEISASKSVNEESLPYFSSSPVEVVDAWDDPGRSLEELLVRIRNANIKVSLPSQITDDQLADLRESLFQNLNLIPGRDAITFQRKDWEKKEPQPWSLYAIGGVIILSILAGTYIVTRTATRQLGIILAKSPKAETTVAPAALSINSNLTPSGTRSNQMDSLDGDLHFNDMVKINEKVKHIASHLASLTTFPCLLDMIDMDDLAEKDPRFLGAIVSEFPKPLQDRLFKISRHKGWLEACVEPGRLNLNSYRFVLKMERRERWERENDWQELLILCWRLDDRFTQFIKNLDEKDAMQLLASMPTSVSIPAARLAFPGSWGRLLDSNYKPGQLADRRIAELKKKALEYRPENNPQMIDAFRHEKGILAFLRTATISDERDIYEASKPDSTIPLIRPPFYVVFNLPQEELARFTPMIPLDKWAMALFNTSRDQRKLVEKNFSEKQRYLFIETLKRFDSIQPDGQIIGDAREMIGRQLALVQRTTKSGSINPAEPDRSSPEEESEDHDSQISAA